MAFISVYCTNDFLHFVPIYLFMTHKIIIYYLGYEPKKAFPIVFLVRGTLTARFLLEG